MATASNKQTFPKGRVKQTIKPEDLIEFEEGDLINLEGGLDSNPLAPRLRGEFTNKGYYLSHRYKWHIIVDDSGDMVLVPVKRKE